MYHRLFSISSFLVVVLTTSAFGQNREIDSLGQLLSKGSVDSIKVLLELARYSNMYDYYDKALECENAALLLALKENDSLKIVMSYRLKGATLRRMEKLDEALAMATKTFLIAKRNNFVDEMKFLLNTMALIYTNKAQYDLALDCNFQSLIVRELQGDQSEISVALNNIGVAYFKLRNYNRALEYFKNQLKSKMR